MPGHQHGRAPGPGQQPTAPSVVRVSRRRFDPKRGSGDPRVQRQPLTLQGCICWEDACGGQPRRGPQRGGGARVPLPRRAPRANAALPHPVVERLRLPCGSGGTTRLPSNVPPSPVGSPRRASAQLRNRAHPPPASRSHSTRRHARTRKAHRRAQRASGGAKNRATARCRRPPAPPAPPPWGRARGKGHHGAGTSASGPNLRPQHVCEPLRSLPCLQSPVPKPRELKSHSLAQAAADQVCGPCVVCVQLAPCGADIFEQAGRHTLRQFLATPRATKEVTCEVNLLGGSRPIGLARDARGRCLEFCG